MDCAFCAVGGKPAPRRVGRPAVDITGQTFSRLTVLAMSGRDRRGNALYRVLCTCGTEKVVLSSNLKSGASRSCGCLRRELTGARFTTHARAQRKVAA
jgi:hypothetical protein